MCFVGMAHTIAIEWMVHVSKHLCSGTVRMVYPTPHSCFITVPHLNHQIILFFIFHSQFSDDVKTSAGFFLGFYDIKGSVKRDGKVTYWERRSKDVNNQRPTIFRYCGTMKRWVLTFASDESKECSQDFIVATGPVEANAMYDVMVASEMGWYAKDEKWQIELPVANFYFKCSSDDDYPLIPENFPDPCGSMRTDELVPGFQGTRSWPSDFVTLKDEANNTVYVYDRPAFYNKSGDLVDVVISLGYRWSLTSSTQLNEISPNLTSSVTAVASYLKNSFHAYTSDYEVSFLSDPIQIETTDDKPVPLGIKWNTASDKYVGIYQTPAKAIDTLFICTICGERNPCYYEGACRKGKCDCINGGSGTLCQISPDKDGACNPFFNTPEFAYDGGDCCSNTCISGERYKCGKDLTGEIDVRYDICSTDRDPVCEGCFRKHGNDIYGDTNSAFSGTSVSFSSSGRVLALGDIGIDMVRVFDNDGSEWKIRGSRIAGPKDSLFGTHVVSSGPDKAAANPYKHIPVTVAASGKKIYKVYDWVESAGEWSDITPKQGLEMLTTTDKAPKIDLAKSGHVFAVQFPGLLRVYEREVFAYVYPGKEIWAPKDFSGTFLDFALSKDGKFVFIAYEDEKLHSWVKRISLIDSSELKIKLTNTVLSVRSSFNGKVFAALVEDVSSAEVRVFRDIDNSQFSSSFYNDTFVRGIPNRMTSIPQISLTDDGLNVFVTFENINSVQTFSWKNGLWVEASQGLTGATFSVLGDGSAIAVADSGNDESGPDMGKVTCFKQKPRTCANNEKLYHFTINLDNAAQESLWHFQTEGNKSNLEDGPYKYDEISVLESICIRDDECMNLVLFDTRGDGMRRPGLIGISKNGIVLQSNNDVFGFEKVVTIPGVKPCTSVDRPWNEMALHRRCRSSVCSWQQLGADVDGKIEFDNSGKAISLSSDGKILAVGAEFHDGLFGNITSAGHVRIYEYNDIKKDWEQLGQDIHGENRFSFFGYSVSLSGDGKTVAAGAPQSIVNDHPGRVRVFSYDDNLKVWKQRGDSLVGENMGDKFGESVSISEDGLSVIAGAINHGFNNSRTGHSRIYRFNSAESKWYQRGQDIEGEAADDYSGIAVDISSDGERVAIGADYNDGSFTSDAKSGHVRIFKFDTNLDDWKQLGQDIDGEAAGDFSGNSLSLSSDGNTIAIGATSNDGNGLNAGHVRVYRYDDNTNTWIKQGNDIDGESSEDNFGGSVSLSSNGQILAVGAKRNDGSSLNAGHARVYQYVERTKMWHQIGYDLDGIAQGDFFGRSVTLSSEGHILAVGSPAHDQITGLSFGHVRAFEFFPLDLSSSPDEGDLQCINDQSPFRLHFTMDKFHEDLSWGLYDDKGRQIIFEQFKDLKQEITSGHSLTRRECLPNSGAISLLIDDLYGDGICCNWGNGTFSVFWDGKKISDSQGFEKLRTMCLPPKEENVVFSLDLTLDDMPPHTYWMLYDSSKQNETMRSPVNYQGYENFAEIKTSVCVPRNHCLTFIMGDNNLDDKGFNGLKPPGGYALSWDSNWVKPKTSNFSAADVVRVGNSCDPPSGQVLVQIILYAGFLATDVEWEISLFDESSKAVLLKGGNYTTNLEGHYHEVFVSTESCLIFKMVKGLDVSYSIMRNGTLIHHAHRELKEINLIRFGSCTSCQDGTKLFQALVWKTDKSISAPIWTLRNNLLQPIFENPTRDVELSYDESCVPLDKCLLFYIYGQSNFTYQVMFDEQVMKYASTSSSDTVKLGTCSKCESGLSLLQFFINTGFQPNIVSWNITSGSGNATKVYLQHHFGDYDGGHLFQNEYADACVPSNECLDIRIRDNCNEACLKYEVLWDKNVVASGATSGQKSPFFRVGSCA